MLLVMFMYADDVEWQRYDQQQWGGTVMLVVMLMYADDVGWQRNGMYLWGWYRYVSDYVDARW